MKFILGKMHHRWPEYILFCHCAAVDFSACLFLCVVNPRSTCQASYPVTCTTNTWATSSIPYGRTSSWWETRRRRVRACPWTMNAARPPRKGRRPRWPFSHTLYQIPSLSLAGFGFWHFCMPRWHLEETALCKHYYVTRGSWSWEHGTKEVWQLFALGLLMISCSAIGI